MPTITITTFGYLHGPPPPAHLCVDLRSHFRDPHVRPELRHMSARDAAVRDAVMATPGVAALTRSLHSAVLAFTAGPGGQDVAVSVGCAGGRHRAATVGAALAAALQHTSGAAVRLCHRDLDKAVVARPSTAGTPDSPEGGGHL